MPETSGLWPLVPQPHHVAFLFLHGGFLFEIHLPHRVLPGADRRGGRVGRFGRSLLGLCRGRLRRPGDKGETDFDAFKCQLSFPRIVPDKTPPSNLQPGEQNDGVHRLTADQPVGLIVYGFDAYVSYGYPGGTDLALINLK